MHAAVNRESVGHAGGPREKEKRLILVNIGDKCNNRSALLTPFTDCNYSSESDNYWSA